VKRKTENATSIDEFGAHSNTPSQRNRKRTLIGLFYICNLREMNCCSDEEDLQELVDVRKAMYFFFNSFSLSRAS